MLAETIPSVVLPRNQTSASEGDAGLGAKLMDLAVSRSFRLVPLKRGPMACEARGVLAIADDDEDATVGVGIGSETFQAWSALSSTWIWKTKVGWLGLKGATSACCSGGRLQLQTVDGSVQPLTLAGLLGPTTVRTPVGMGGKLSMDRNTSGVAEADADAAAVDDLVSVGDAAGLVAACA